MPGASVLVGSLLLSISAYAAGSPAGSANEAQANDLIHRGLELRRAGKSDEALDLLRRAHALAPSPRALGQLGLAEASTQRWLEAETHLGAALALREDAWIRRNDPLLEHALHEARQHIGELELTGPAGTDVKIDGRAVGTLPDLRPLHLAAGRSLVTASGNGFKQFMKTVVIQAGARTTLAIVLEPMGGPALVLAPPAPSATSPLVAEPERAGATIWTGAAIAVVGAGLLTWGAIVIDDHDTRTAGWMLAAGGAAAVAGGAALVLVGERRDEPVVALRLGPTSARLCGRF
jgi:tetratricopeptide (TPR) repeat protein